MTDLKRRGLRELPLETQEPLAALLSDLESQGIYLVPFGELEEWLVDRGLQSSKTRNKWAWANVATQYIRENDTEQEDIWGFVRRLGDHLTKQLQ